MNPIYIQALGAAGATLALVQNLLTNDKVGAELRATLPPDVLAQLVERIEKADKLIEAALADYEAEQMRGGRN